VVFLRITPNVLICFPELHLHAAEVELQLLATKAYARVCTFVERNYNVHFVTNCFANIFANESALDSWERVAKMICWIAKRAGQISFRLHGLVGVHLNIVLP